MITVGVDLASQSNDTALAVVEWKEGRSAVLRVVVGADDEMILDEGTKADVIGIASPFGWPEPFFELLRQNREGRVGDPRRAATVSGRDGIMYRTTERRVRDWLGLKLMPSTSNMLGSTVLRCVGLQTRLDEAGVSVTRGQGGRVIEVYAPASLMAWGLHEPSYKNQSASRVRILEQVGRRLNCYLGEYRTLCVESDDALDALVGALTARAAALGFWRQPMDEEERLRASAEGWISVPSGTVETLLGSQPPESNEGL